MTAFRSVLTWREPGQPWREVGMTDRTVINHRDDDEGKRKAMRAVPLGFEWRLEVFSTEDFYATTALRTLYGRRVARGSPLPWPRSRRRSRSMAS